MQTSPGTGVEANNGPTAFREGRKDTKITKKKTWGVRALRIFAAFVTRVAPFY